MNNLSWLIYAADVAGNLGNFLIVFGAACILGSVFVAMIADCENWDFGIWLAKRMPFAGVAALLFGCLIPSQTTVYAIAASEMGENVLNSETGGKAVKALNAWLDRQIAEPSQDQSQ